MQVRLRINNFVVVLQKALVFPFHHTCHPAILYAKAHELFEYQTDLWQVSYLPLTAAESVQKVFVLMCQMRRPLWRITTDPRKHLDPPADYAYDDLTLQIQLFKKATNNVCRWRYFIESSRREFIYFRDIQKSFTGDQTSVSVFRSTKCLITCSNL